MCVVGWWWLVVGVGAVGVGGGRVGGLAGVGCCRLVGWWVVGGGGCWSVGGGRWVSVVGWCGRGGLVWALWRLGYTGICGCRWWRRGVGACL